MTHNTVDDFLVQAATVVLSLALIPCLGDPSVSMGAEPARRKVVDDHTASPRNGIDGNVALGVEEGWSAQFSEALTEAGKSPDDDQYSPHWYRGHHWQAVGASGFASALNSSFSSAVSSSSTAPGSSSGGGGGGFSGGGGGGGGGGGW